VARPKNADGARTRQAILDAALDLFAEKGYFGTSLRDVATAVGVRESALYNYFASKDGLFDALLAAHQSTKLERLAPLDTASIADSRAVLEQLAVATLAGFVDARERKLFRILMSDGIRLARVGRINLHERMGAGRERLHDFLRRLVRHGVLRRADVNVLGLAFFSPLAMWRQLHAIDADLPMIRHPRAFARQHVEQFLLGASPRVSRPVRTSSRRRSSSLTTAPRSARV
jgi:AcrR family transcriptional regulator